MVFRPTVHVFSATLVNTVRVGYSRSVGQQNLPVAATNPLADDTSLGIGGGAHAPTINVQSGITGIQGGWDSLLLVPTPTIPTRPMMTRS